MVNDATHLACTCIFIYVIVSWIMVLSILFGATILKGTMESLVHILLIVVELNHRS